MHNILGLIRTNTEDIYILDPYNKMQAIKLTGRQLLFERYEPYSIEVLLNRHTSDTILIHKKSLKHLLM